MPFLIVILRYAIFPTIKRFKKLSELQEILGAVEWGLERNKNIDTFEAIKKINTSFSFMGFGFSKYLKASNDQEMIDSKINLRQSLLWDKLKEICVKSPQQKIQVLLMNPLALEIEKYSKLIDKRYPMVDDLYFGLDCLRDIRKSFGESVQVRFYPNSLTYKPSFRLFFFNEHECYVSFYQWGTSATDLPYLHMKQGEKNFFHPFKILFDYFWEHGETADIDNMPFTIRLRDIYNGENNSLNRLKNYIFDQLPAHLKNIPFDRLRIAIAAIAGRDSAISILQSAVSGDYDCIVPVLIGAPSEFLPGIDHPISSNALGDFMIRSDTIKNLKQVIKKIDDGLEQKCYILNIVNISTGTQPWSDFLKKTRTVWRFQTDDPSIDYALSTPCVPCHIYIHYLRAMLCNRLGIKIMISGDRIYHDNFVKLNQMKTVLEKISDIIRHDFDVNLTLPLLDIRDSRALQRNLELFGINQIYDVDCYFSGQCVLPAEKYQKFDKILLSAVNDKIEHEIVIILRKTLRHHYGNN